MGEPLATVFTLKGLLTTMNPLVFLEVVFELEGLAALVTLKPSEYVRLLVGDHVSLQAVNVGELLVAHRTRHAGAAQEVALISHGSI